MSTPIIKLIRQQQRKLAGGRAQPRNVFTSDVVDFVSTKRAPAAQKALFSSLVASNQARECLLPLRDQQLFFVMEAARRHLTSEKFVELCSDAGPDQAADYIVNFGKHYKVSWRTPATNQFGNVVMSPELTQVDALAFLTLFGLAGAKVAKCLLVFHFDQSAMRTDDRGRDLAALLQLMARYHSAEITLRASGQFGWVCHYDSIAHLGQMEHMNALLTQKMEYNDRGKLITAVFGALGGRGADKHMRACLLALQHVPADEQGARNIVSTVRRVKLRNEANLARLNAEESMARSLHGLLKPLLDFVDAQPQPDDSDDDDDAKSWQPINAEDTPRPLSSMLYGLTKYPSVNRERDRSNWCSGGSLAYARSAANSMSFTLNAAPAEAGSYRRRVRLLNRALHDVYRDQALALVQTGLPIYVIAQILDYICPLTALLLNPMQRVNLIGALVNSAKRVRAARDSTADNGRQRVV